MVNCTIVEKREKEKNKKNIAVHILLRLSYIRIYQPRN